MNISKKENAQFAKFVQSRHFVDWFNVQEYGQSKRS